MKGFIEWVTSDVMMWHLKEAMYGIISCIVLVGGFHLILWLNARRKHRK